MFTGIIEQTARVKDRTERRLTLERPASFTDLVRGASIAVSGVCLTVAELTASVLTFDVVPETWARSTLGEKQQGSLVNLERALPATGRFDGHIVQGHVEGRATVRSLVSSGVQGKDLTVDLPEDLLPFVTEKGSICLDGVSLTVAHLQGAQCSVALIPETLARTTLGSLEKGARVNVETDIIGKYIARQHSLFQP